MRSDQWNRVVTLSLGVDEMNELVVDRRRVVIELVEPALCRSPIELLTPVSTELFEIGDRRPVIPVRRLDFVGPAGGLKSPLQIIELLFRNGYLERLQVQHGSASSACVAESSGSVDPTKRSTR